MKNNKFLQYLKWVWLAAVVVFVGYYFYKHLPEVLGYLKTINLAKLFFSILLIAIAKMFLVEMARLSVSTDTWRPSYWRMFSIVTVTQLGKYIPGSIWHFAARVSTYKENDLSNKKTAKAMILENAWLVFSALVFGLLLLSLQPPKEILAEKLSLTLSPTLWTILPFIIVALWLAGMFVLDKLFLSEKGEFSLIRLLHLVAVQACAWMAMGSSFYLIFQGANSEHFLQIVGGYAISWMIGYLFIFAPSGIGVREVVLVTLFSTLVPTEQIAAYSIVHRLLFTVVEVILGLIGFLVQREYFTANTSHPLEKK